MKRERRSEEAQQRHGARTNGFREAGADRPGMQVKRHRPNDDRERLWQMWDEQMRNGKLQATLNRGQSRFGDGRASGGRSLVAGNHGSHQSSGPEAQARVPSASSSDSYTYESIEDDEPAARAGHGAQHAGGPARGSHDARRPPSPGPVPPQLSARGPAPLDHLRRPGPSAAPRCHQEATTVWSTDAGRGVKRRTRRGRSRPVCGDERLPAEPGRGRHHVRDTNRFALEVADGRQDSVRRQSRPAPETTALSPMPASEANGSRRLTRVGVGLAYVVHGVIFDFDDQTRLGRLLRNDGSDMDLLGNQAGTWKKRYVKWEDMQDGEYVCEVLGCGSISTGASGSYLAGDIVVRTNKGRQLEWFGTQDSWKTQEQFHFVADPGDQIINMKFDNGTAVGIETARAGELPSGRCKLELEDRVRPQLAIAAAPAESMRHRPAALPLCDQRHQSPDQRQDRRHWSPNQRQVQEKRHQSPNQQQLQAARHRSPDQRQLQDMSLSELLKYVRQLSTDNSSVDDALDCEDPRAAIIRLIEHRQGAASNNDSRNGIRLPRPARLPSRPRENGQKAQAPAERTSSKLKRSAAQRLNVKEEAVPDETEERGRERRKKHKASAPRTNMGAAVPSFEARDDGSIDRQPRRERSPRQDLPAVRVHGDIQDVTSNFDTWKAHIEAGAKELYQHLEDYYKTINKDKWEFTCEICSKVMCLPHLMGKAHWQTVKALAQDKADASAYQIFRLPSISKEIGFDHLSGECRLGPLQIDTALDGRDRSLSSKPPALPAISDAESKQKPAGGVHQDFSDALHKKDAWRKWIETSAQELEANLEEGLDQRSEFGCLICSRKVGSAQEHLCSAGHWKEIWKIYEKNGSPSFADVQKRGFQAPWVQAFELKSSRFIFNHLTGEHEPDDTCKRGKEYPEQRADTVEDAAPSASREPAQAPNAWKEPEPWEDPREPAPQPEIKLVFLPADEQGDADSKFAHIATGATRASPSYYPLVDRRYPLRLRKFGKEQIEFGWTGADCWTLRWPRESSSRHCVVVLGLCCGEERSKLQGRLNGTPLDIKTRGSQRFHERTLSWSIDPGADLPWNDAVFTMDGPFTQYVAYLHMWVKGFPGAPEPDGAKEETHSAALEVPVYASAKGRAADWNKPEAQLSWASKAAKQIFWNFPQGGRADINCLLEFLAIRKDKNEDSVLNLLGPPVKQDKDWYSLAWKDYDRHEEKCKEWEPAWHGCKMEALYSILYHGKLFESKDGNQGQRTLSNAPGVYVFKEGTSHKAENYIRFVPLCGDGVFWAAKFEVRVDRSQRVKCQRSTDQWVQQEGSVQLVALWVCGRNASTMRFGDNVSPKWDPELEANPKLQTQKDESLSEGIDVLRLA